jgi:hypothetical protein
VSAHASARERKPALAVGDGRQCVQQIPGGASEAVEPGDHQYIAGAECGDGLPQLGAVGLGPARHFPEYLIGPSGAESGHLCRNALAVGRDPGIAEFHGGLMAVSYAKEKGPDINGLVFLQNS